MNTLNPKFDGRPNHWLVNCYANCQRSIYALQMAKDILEDHIPINAWITRFSELQEACYAEMRRRGIVE